jgi:hypothetical protein
MNMQGSNSSSNVSPSWTWGSSATINFDLSQPGTTVLNSAQLAQVSLPEPAVCSIYIQAGFLTNFPGNVVRTFTLNLTEGVGRVAVPRQITFQFQPALNAPLEFTLPFVPVHALQVNAEATLDVLSEEPTDTASLEMYFVLSPLTRIPQKIQKLQFGMAMPGEADDLDDELSGELEAEGPSVVEAMREGRQMVDGSSPEAERDEDAAGDELADDVQRAPAWLMTLIDQMTRRLGRQPTRPELAKAVQRVRLRLARRAGR